VKVISDSSSTTRILLFVFVFGDGDDDIYTHLQPFHVIIILEMGSRGIPVSMWRPLKYYYDIFFSTVSMFTISLAFLVGLNNLEFS
jgi:hypothetical protein